MPFGDTKGCVVTDLAPEGGVSSFISRQNKASLGSGRPDLPNPVLPSVCEIYSGAFSIPRL
jgi:hypothetical protein